MDTHYDYNILHAAFAHPLLPTAPLQLTVPGYHRYAGKAALCAFRFVPRELQHIYFSTNETKLLDKSFRAALKS